MWQNILVCCGWASISISCTTADGSAGGQICTWCSICKASFVVLGTFQQKVLAIWTWSYLKVTSTPAFRSTSNLQFAFTKCGLLELVRHFCRHRKSHWKDDRDDFLSILAFTLTFFTNFSYFSPVFLVQQIFTCTSTSAVSKRVPPSHRPEWLSRLVSCRFQKFHRR